jgi:serine/threonine-protein kinase HipA
MNLLEIIIWNKLVGVLVWDEETSTSSFQYADSFIKSGIQVSPYAFPTTHKSLSILYNPTHSSRGQLTINNYEGLPLFISDSLPDKFGSKVFSKYLEKSGRNYRDLNPLEKLSYIGNRGMGALEFKPTNHAPANYLAIQMKQLSLLSKSLANNEPIAHIAHIENLFHLGSSPGGAQPKALININKYTGFIYRGDQTPLADEESWILKFNKDIGLSWDFERGKMEYAYYLMAKNSKIHIMESRLHEFNHEFYFMTKRFDRPHGGKIHTQTLHAFAGMNFKSPNTYSYEQVFTVLNSMNFDYSAKEQLFRIMVFNVMGNNVDDHTKNFGLMMNEQGQWSFSPAYDLTFTYNENYHRETPHFLSINGKNKEFVIEDLLIVANEFGIKNSKKIISEIRLCFLEWNLIAEKSKLSKETTKYIGNKFQLF